MDCDTTGWSLILRWSVQEARRRRYFKIANQSIEPALRNLGYSADERHAILEYVLGTMTLDGAPSVNRESLRDRGFLDEDIDKIEVALPAVFELGFAFNVWTLGRKLCSGWESRPRMRAVPDSTCCERLGSASAISMRRMGSSAAR